MLAPKGAARIGKDLELAIGDPERYLVRNAKRMDDRNVDAPHRELPFLALVEGLTTAKRLVEIDWKTSGVELGWALGKIAPKAGVKWLAAVDEIEDDRSTLELLEEAGQRLLAEHALQLAHLDLGSDSFCLVVAPPAIVKRCATLAKATRLGAIEAFTGKGLAAAKRERVARQQRDAREAKLDAKRAAEAADAWQFFAKGKATRAYKAAPLAIDTEHEAPGVKYYANHYYPTEKHCRASVKQLVAAWKREGFRPIDRATYAKLGIATSAYIGWVGPFPEGGVYWLENKKVVRCLVLEGDAVVSLGGLVGKNFAELQNYRHYESAEAARRALDAEVAARDATYKRITRVELVKRF